MSDLDYDVIVIGAGFAGLYALHKLRDEAGLRVHVFERGGDVGGTWYWNRYPGARCDAESIYYCYSFPDIQQEWTWTERFATQPEILDYARYVADRLDLRTGISFNAAVASARWDETANTWTVTTENGETARSRFLVTAVGCLSASQIPDFPGLGSFQGPAYHTGRWPHEGVDFAGQRVAIIGTGSSGIQAIPEIARQAAHVTVFQRTPSYSVPARNRDYPEDEMTAIKGEYDALRARAAGTAGGSWVIPPKGTAADFTPDAQQAELDRRWDEGGPGYMFAFADSMVNLEANNVAADYLRAKIRQIVRDPATAELLCPTTYPIGAKRICVDTDYYETYNRPNVTLVSVRDQPVEAITAHGVRVGGTEYEADAIVFATGYDAMTGPLTRIGIHGADGLALADAWSSGPHTYLGLAVSGFPNLFIVTGPGSPSVLTNVVSSIEQHVDWIAGYLTWLERSGITRVEADLDAQDKWVEHVNVVAGQTLFPRGNSWYIGANIPGKKRVFMPYAGGLNNYRATCDDIAARGYAGFTHESANVRQP
jgi:cyclohexanone monooxygenase